MILQYWKKKMINWILLSILFIEIILVIIAKYHEANKEAQDTDEEMPPINY